MRKILTSILILSALIIGLTSCGKTNVREDQDEGSGETTVETANEKPDKPENVAVNEAEYEMAVEDDMMLSGAPAPTFSRGIRSREKRAVTGGGYDQPVVEYNTESYDKIDDNPFKNALANPISTFSIDVDTAAYANVRRFLNSSQLPPKDAVRIEEMINYFDYNYELPKSEHPFSVNTEYGECPWNSDRKLLHIGIQGRDIDPKQLPAANLVFLLDVSGSMSYLNKLPLLKKAFKMLIDNLGAQDKVSIVVYAGAAGMVLEPTPGNEKEKIMEALNNLSAGGSTAGGEGIKLAYKTAKENLIEGGNNRIILATDGDFNVGQSSDAEMTRLVEKMRDTGVAITVLGFGMGNYKDSKMEDIADHGNGNYAYIDSVIEAKKVLVHDLRKTLFTIAKDVKIQVEFNPAKVKEYRLIGYENRMLEKEDFTNDQKDAGELGAGHTVTALYEIVTATKDDENSENLKYVDKTVKEEAYDSDEIATVRLRYKKPNEDSSIPIEVVLNESELESKGTGDNFTFSAAIAQFGMLLRDSEHKGSANIDDAIEMAREAKGEDKYGYREELVSLMNKFKMLDDVKE